MHALRPRREPKLRKHGFQKSEALVERIEQHELDIRPCDEDGHAGEARAGAHVDAPRTLRHERERQEAVREVLFRHVLRGGECGQVHARVPVHEHGVIRFKLCKLLRREERAEGGKAFAHGISFRQAN